MLFVGIDPGKGGGIAAVDDHGGVVFAEKMPATEADLLLLIKRAQPIEDGVVRLRSRALLEKVASSPQMGVVSAFTFGKGYGALLMALTAAQIPFDPISPVKWQTLMGCLSKGDKSITKRRAQQLFPGWPMTHAIADALLLAECCRRFCRRLRTATACVVKS